MKSRAALEEPMQQPRAASAIVDPNKDDLADRAASIEQLIARRAYQLFEERGYLEGCDLEDWLQAESEILPAISVSTYEFEDNLITRAQLPLLSADEIEVQVEERRIVIADKLPLNLDGDDGAQPRRRIFRTVALPESVDWANAATTFKDGILEVSVRRLSAIHGFLTNEGIGDAVGDEGYADSAPGTNEMLRTDEGRNGYHRVYETESAAPSEGQTR